MTVPCGLADSTIYRENTRRSARFYALRAARGTARSRHAPYISTRKRAFSTSWGRHICRPLQPSRYINLSGKPHGTHICVPYKPAGNLHFPQLYLTFRLFIGGLDPSLPFWWLPPISPAGWVTPPATEWERRTYGLVRRGGIYAARRLSKK